MELEKTNAQMRKGVLELCILSIISSEESFIERGGTPGGRGHLIPATYQIEE